MDGKLKEGDRVMYVDATEDAIPAYRDMRGTVIGFDWTYVLVDWDCDKGLTEGVSIHDQRRTSRVQPERLKKAVEDAK